MTGQSNHRQSCWRILPGDCVAVMAAMDEASIDAIVCDPPYGLEFMGKDWDGPKGFRRAENDADAGRDNVFGRTSRTSPESAAAWDSFGGKRDAGARGGTGDKGILPGYGRGGTGEDRARFKQRSSRVFQEWCEQWGTEALRVLKPGGYLLAMGGTRTYHRLVAGLEDAGFEIRDQIAWIYGSGFPKHPSCLKPAQEPIVLARKASRYSEPLQIDAARIGDFENTTPSGMDRFNARAHEQGYRPSDYAKGSREGEQSADRRYTENGSTNFAATPGVRGGDPAGRWPANVTLDPEAAALLDEQTGTLTSGSGPLNRNADKFRTTYGKFKGGDEPEDVLYGDTGGASRFFYVAKPDGTERHVGLAGRNPHPTVKPVALMRWLCRLITPPGGTVLDPFTGSGTTGIAALREGFSFIGIEQDAEYVDVARARIVGDAPLINGATEMAA